MIENVRETFDLNDPIFVQYFRYLGRIAHGDFGRSFATDEPVREAIFDRLPETALLALAAAIIQITIGVPLGLIAALKRRTFIDRGILLFSLVGVVVPAFVLGFLFLYFFAFKLGWFPLGGSGSFSQLVLPALTLGVAGAAWYARMLRSTTLNILSEDYVRMARAKGLSERLVVLRHVMRNAIGPIITMIGLDVGVFLGGVLIIERVFAWPGIGDQAWRGNHVQRYPDGHGHRPDRRILRHDLQPSRRPRQRRTRPTCGVCLVLDPDILFHSRAETAWDAGAARSRRSSM